MTKENIIKTFEEIESLIRNAKKYPNISDEIYRIYNQNPEDFLAAISLIFPEESINGKPLLHQAVEQGQLEIVATISEIYALSKTVYKSYSHESSSENVKHPRSILGREISGPRIIVPKKNEILKIRGLCNYSLLHESVYHRRYDTVEWLINKGVDLNPQNASLKTPLILSTHIGNYWAFSLLIKNKADMHITDKDGYSALHYAVKKNHILYVKDLLKYGADINQVSLVKKNALYLASRRGNLKMIKILVRHAEENSIKLENIESAIAVARGEYEEEIIEILGRSLESYEAKVEETAFIELASATPFTQKNNTHNLRG